MYKTVFVILHYMNIDDTVNCIDSIMKNAAGCDIVVVDNASSNGTGEQLCGIYQTSNGIHILLNKENSGFAKGNNVGYEYAKDKLLADFIICINNDTLIEDSSFINKIISFYEQSHFDVMGPDVYNPITQVHQSPIRSEWMNENDVKTAMKNNRKLKSILLVKNLLDKLKIKSYAVPAGALDKSYANMSDKAVIHGACVIYSANYIKSENTAFVPDTFMYYEEDLLKLRCLKNKYKMIYNPNIRIAHLEGKSTNFAAENQYKKDLFRLEQSNKSLIIYHSMLTKGGKNIEKS